MSVDLLVQKIKEKGNPSVAGLQRVRQRLYGNLTRVL